MAGRITEILAEVRRGEPGARDDLLRLIYEELRGLAAAAMKRQRRGHTLQPTALVHEAYLRLMGGDDVSYENREHFIGAAGRAMRSILVDMARARAAEKRGGGRVRITWKDDVHGRRDTAEEVVAIHEALKRLEALDPRKSRLVELRFFVGLTREETARVLRLPPRTADRLWQQARAWLYREIGR